MRIFKYAHKYSQYSIIKNKIYNYIWSKFQVKIPLMLIMHLLLLQISQHLKHLANNSTFLGTNSSEDNFVRYIAFGKTIWNKTSRRQQTLSYSRDFFGKTCGNKLIFCIYDKERHSCFVYFTSHLEDFVLQKHCNKPSKDIDAQESLIICPLKKRGCSMLLTDHQYNNYATVSSKLDRVGYMNHHWPCDTNHLSCVGTLRHRCNLK